MDIYFNSFMTFTQKQMQSTTYNTVLQMWF